MPPWKTVDLVLPGTFALGVALGVAVGYSAQKLITAFFMPSEELKQMEPFPREEGEMETDQMQKEVDSLLTIEGPSRNAFLLSTVFRPALLNILNKCDPVTFTRVSMTCKGIRFVCLNSRGLRIPFHCKVVMTEGWNEEEEEEEFYVSTPRFKYLKHNEGYRVAFGRQLEHLKRLPFHFEIYVKFRGVLEIDDDQVSAVENFINQFPVFSVKRMFIKEEDEIYCWPKLTTFIKEHRVRRLIAKDSFMEEDEMKSLLALAFDKVELAANIPEGMLHKIRSKEMSIENANVVAEDFQKLIKDVGNSVITEIEYWEIMKLSENLRTTASFVKCFDDIQKILFDHNEDLPTSRPLACFTENSVCLVLTKENRVFRFRHFNTREGFLSVLRVDSCGSSRNDLPEAFRPFVK